MSKVSVFLKIVFACVFLLSFSPALAKKKTKLSYGDTIALSSANLINRYKTVGQFVKVFRPHMNGRDYHTLKKTLTAQNISMKDKLPKVKAQGSKILINGAGYIEIKNSKLMVINGHKFRGSEEDISKRFRSIYSKLSKKKKTRVSIMNILVPEAHAFGDLMGIVSLFGAGLGGYYFGPKLGVKKSTGALLGVGGLYLATELWQSFKKGDITCTDDGRYQQRSKGRNMWFMAMKEQTIIDSAKIREAGLAEACTKNNAAALEEWAKVGRLNTPSPVINSEPSTAIYGE